MFYTADNATMYLAFIKQWNTAYRFINKEPEKQGRFYLQNASRLYQLG